MPMTPTLAAARTAPLATLSPSPGLDRERRNADARARIAESRARISRREGDLRRARQARTLAERAARACQIAA